MFALMSCSTAPIQKQTVPISPFIPVSLYECTEAPRAPEAAEDEATMQTETAVFETRLALAYKDCKGNLLTIREIIGQFNLRNEIKPPVEDSDPS